MFKDGINHIDDIMEEEKEFIEGDLDASDIASYTNQFGKQHISGDGNRMSIFVPPEEWIKLKQRQKDQFIAKHCQEQMNDISPIRPTSIK
jgi:hypothetical protein